MDYFCENSVGLTLAVIVSLRVMFIVIDKLIFIFYPGASNRTIRILYFLGVILYTFMFVYNQYYTNHLQQTNFGKIITY